MRKTKTTESHSELNPTENELEMNICLLRKLLRKLFFIFVSFFQRHSKVNLRTLTYIFYKSKAPEKTKSMAFSTVS